MVGGSAARARDREVGGGGWARRRRRSDVCSATFEAAFHGSRGTRGEGGEEEEEKNDFVSGKDEDGDGDGRTQEMQGGRCLVVVVVTDETVKRLIIFHPLLSSRGVAWTWRDAAGRRRSSREDEDERNRDGGRGLSWRDGDNKHGQRRE